MVNIPLSVNFHFQSSEIMKLSPLLSLAFTSLYSVSYVHGQHIEKNTFTVGNTIIQGDTLIDKGVWWTLVRPDLETFTSTVNISGGLYIFSDNLTSLKVNTNKCQAFINSGIVFFKVLLTSANYYLKVGEFENSGDMFLLAETTNSISYRIESEKWVNHVGATFNMYLDSRIARETVTLGIMGKSISNEGQICLKNFRWNSTSAIVGKGCIDIGINSIFQYNLPRIPMSSDQTFYLSSPSSTLYVGSTEQYLPYTVAGFGNGNVIALSKRIIKYSYDDPLGILILQTALYTMKFQIGHGYDPDLFYLMPAADLGPGIGDTKLYAAFSYDGNVPDESTSSSVCKFCQDEPMFPPEGSLT